MDYTRTKGIVSLAKKSDEALQIGAGLAVAQNALTHPTFFKKMDSFANVPNGAVKQRAAMEVLSDTIFNKNSGREIISLI